METETSRLMTPADIAAHARKLALDAPPLTLEQRTRLRRVLLCLTIFGIPFGLVSFRLAGLALAPLGREVVRRGSVPAGAKVVATA